MDFRDWKLSNGASGYQYVLGARKSQGVHGWQRASSKARASVRKVEEAEEKGSQGWGR